jgi:rRNA maturation protein Nop10
VVAGDTTGTLYHCSTCGETLESVDSCPRCDQAGSLSPPWMLTKDGWRQQRIDGTTWMLDPGVNGVLIPTSSQSLQSPGVTTCEREHRYRLAVGVSCPECGASASAHVSPAASALPAPSGKKPSPLVPVLVAVILAAALVAGISLDRRAADVDHQVSTTSPATTPVTTRSSTTTQARTTTTAFEPVLGWVVGACVELVGEMAGPVSCSKPHDAEVIDIVVSQANCPSRTRWLVELESRVACLVET